MKKHKARMASESGVEDVYLPARSPTPRRPLSPYVGLGFLLLAVVVALLRLAGVIGG